MAVIGRGGPPLTTLGAISVAMWTSSLKCRGKEAGSPCLAGTGPTHPVVSLAPRPHPLPGLVARRSSLLIIALALGGAARLVPSLTGSRRGYSC